MTGRTRSWFARNAASRDVDVVVTGTGGEEPAIYEPPNNKGGKVDGGSERPINDLRV